MFKSLVLLASFATVTSSYADMNAMVSFQGANGKALPKAFYLCENVTSSCEISYNGGQAIGSAGLLM